MKFRLLLPVLMTSVASLAQNNLTVNNALYFNASGNATDGFPWARFNENWGIRFNSPDPHWVLSSKPSVLIGYVPSGQNWGNDNLLVAGNVGIGTTSPNARLHLFDGGFRHGAPGEISIDAVGIVGGRFKILDNGNVGIGTAAPIARLQVESGSDAAIALRLQSGGFSMNGTAPFSIDANGVFSGRFVVLGSGNVGIGIANPTQKLQVKGTVYSTEVKVDLAAGQGPDYVFEPTYDLKPLAEIETYIKENKHLPEVPSAKEMEKNGVQLGEMNMLLLRKIEELTLYILDQNKEIEKLKERSVSTDASGKKIEELTFHLIEMKKQNEELKNRVEKIENKK